MQVGEEWFKAGGFFDLPLLGILRHVVVLASYGAMCRIYLS